MIECFIVEVPYTSEGGAMRVMRTRPLTWTDARATVEGYERRSIKARVVEIAALTQLSLDVIAGRMGLGDARQLAKTIVAAMPQTSSTRSRRKGVAASSPADNGPLFG